MIGWDANLCGEDAGGTEHLLTVTGEAACAEGVRFMKRTNSIASANTM